MQNLNTRFNSSLSNFKLPKKEKIKLALYSFSKTEWKIFFSLLLVLLVSTIWILGRINQSFMVAVPMEGGSLSEGIVGSPRFVNPVLAFSDTDRDIVSLVYSGLMRKNTTGAIVPDLAESYEVSKDGLTYTFILKDNLSFHDGEVLNADDVVFTIEEINDPVIKSPRKGNWEGVEVQKVDDKTIKFILRKPYSSFLENTTLGILPKDLWSGSPIELNDANINPIGSGPYKIESVSKNSTGVVDSYTLSSFAKFALGKPYLKKITLKFYENEDNSIKAFENGEVDQISSITPENTPRFKDKGERIESSTLPRVFGLFFNQNQNQVFTDKNVVKAINLAIDKDRIINEVLYGYGVVIESPIPVNLIKYQKLNQSVISTHAENILKAKEILAKDGWAQSDDGYLQKTTIDSKNKKKKTTASLAFSISTGNAPELAKTAELIKEDLEKIGIKVEVKTFEVGNLNQMVIRPRKYDALLFGQIINFESDLYAFWHSSQRKDPGLNVAMYTNAKVDKILEDAFVTIDANERAKKYAQFEDEVAKDLPAVFLYSPNFIYVVSKNLQGLSIDHISSPRDRFLSAYLWYNKIDNVWKIFSKQ